MILEFFGEWLKFFNHHVAKSDPNCKVLLLIDNCPAHGKSPSLPVLSNVEITFLPPRTTSKIQPMDVGIIAAYKMRYKQKQVMHAVNLLEAQASNFYHGDIVQAMEWCKVNTYHNYLLGVAGYLHLAIY